MRRQSMRGRCTKNSGGHRSVILSAALHVVRVFHCTPVSCRLQSRGCGGVTALRVWDDTIWPRLMGLICSNWKWGRG